jgi:prepilin-type processing-associated H-X9-DG protein/prepilin-type N-terminal cleavage/methylation domain-containing protein
MGRDRKRFGFAASGLTGFTSGFTLVELLVVVGIIAVLIGILMPALTKARKAAYEAACMSNMRQWGIGIQMYVDQNRGALPSKGEGADGSTQANAFGPISNGNGVVGYDDQYIWFNAIPPFVGGKSYYNILLDAYNGKGQVPQPGDHSIFVCPVAGPVGTYGKDIVAGNYFLLYGVDSSFQIMNSTGQVPAYQFKADFCYVWNSKLTTTITGGDQDATGIKMSTLRPGSEVVIMTEKIVNPGEYQDPGVQRWSNANPSVYINKGNMNSKGSLVNIAQPKADWTRFTARHNGGGNLLFADGHVQWYSWPQVQYPASQLPYTSNSNANQPGKMLWSAYGPVN